MDPKQEDAAEIVIASKLLKNKIFSGVYAERRLIEFGPLAMYKDVIIVNESEQEFIECLRKANRVLKSGCPSLLTTCISESTSQYSLWTNIHGVAFGSHWFQIRGLAVNQNVMNINLKYLRSISPTQISPSEPIFDWNSFSINSNTLRNVSHIFTRENLVQSLRFVLVVLLAIAVGCYQVLLLLVQLVHELNFLIRSMIPFFIACVESITKAFGGLLILIAMMWRTPKTSTAPGKANSSMGRIRPAYTPNAAQQYPNRYSYNFQNPVINYGNIPRERMQY